MHSNPLGRPKCRSSLPKARSMIMCSSCFGVKGKGIVHKCTKSYKQINLIDITKSSSENTKGKVTSSVLKDMCKDSGVSLKGGHINLATGGKNLSIQVGKSAMSLPKPRFSHENLKRLQAANNFSDRAVKSIAAAFRVVAGRKSIEPNLSSSLVERNKSLEYLFNVKCLKMKEKFKGEDKINSPDGLQLDENGYKDILREGVFCKDCDDLLKLVVRERGLNPHESDVHVGFDGGQGILKIGFTVTPKDSNIYNSKGRSSYREGVAAKSAKHSSVKKLIILAAVPNVPENYSNVKLILNELNMEALEFTYSADVKMLMTLVGKSAGKPKFGCPFCSACTPYTENGNLYTMQDIVNLHNAYTEAGSKAKTQQLYQNFTNHPLITSLPDKLIIEMLAVPELHLLLGVVNKLMDEIESQVFLSKSDGKEFMDNFLKSAGVVRQAYQGGQHLEGNQCKRFLDKLDLLESQLQSKDSLVIVQGMPFVQALRAFKDVVEQCFKVNLDPDYKTSISNFKKQYLDLEISVTPKVHIVFQHIIEFLDLVNRDTEDMPKGLGYFSEQAFESVHSDMAIQWDKVKVGMHHAEFGQRLKSFVISYNAKHI